MRLNNSGFCFLGALLLAGCAAQRPPLPDVPQVDLPRFMGDWYVIASIPTPFEGGAHNAVESYKLDADGTIATTFSYRDGSFDGKVKTMHPRGYVLDKESNAVWAMQFFWPIKSDFRIAYVSSDYKRTIIAREKRDYVWIMARAPSISAEEYARLKKLVTGFGYDVEQLERVPQRW